MSSSPMTPTEINGAGSRPWTVPGRAKRRDFTRKVLPSAEIGEIDVPLPLMQRIWGVSLVRRIVILAIIAALWEGYARWLDNPLSFPTLGETLTSLWTDLSNGVLPDRLQVSLRILLMGYGIGIVLAA